MSKAYRMVIINELNRIYTETKWSEGEMLDRKIEYNTKLKTENEIYSISISEYLCRRWIGSKI